MLSCCEIITWPGTLPWHSERVLAFVFLQSVTSSWISLKVLIQFLGKLNAMSLVKVPWTLSGQGAMHWRPRVAPRMLSVLDMQQKPHWLSPLWYTVTHKSGNIVSCKQEGPGRDPGSTGRQRLGAVCVFLRVVMGVAFVNSHGTASWLPTRQRRLRSVYKRAFRLLPYGVLQNRAST